MLPNRSDRSRPRGVAHLDGARHRRAVTVAAVAVALVTVVACDSDVVVAPGGTDVPPTSSPPPAEAADAERRIERAIFDLANRERQRRGLPPLAWDDQLADRAQAWSRQMQQQGELVHQDTEVMLQRVEGFTAVGENIFRATGPVPASTIHVVWMRSAGHRANILREGFGRLGVGVVCTPDGAVWATQRFGRVAGSDHPRPQRGTPPEQPIVAEEGNGPSCPGGGDQVEIDVLDLG